MLATDPPTVRILRPCRPGRIGRVEIGAPIAPNRVQSAQADFSLWPPVSTGGYADCASFSIDDQRSLLLQDDLLADDDLARGSCGRDVVHDVEHRLLEDGAQAAGAGLAPDRLGWRWP